MPYSVVTAQQACSTEMVKLHLQDISDAAYQARVAISMTISRIYFGVFGSVAFGACLNKINALFKE